MKKLINKIKIKIDSCKNKYKKLKTVLNVSFIVVLLLFTLVNIINLYLSIHLLSPLFGHVFIKCAPLIIKCLQLIIYVVQLFIFIIHTIIIVNSMVFLLFYKTTVYKGIIVTIFVLIFKPFSD